MKTEKYFIRLATLCILFALGGLVFWISEKTNSPRIPRSEEAPLLFANEVSSDLPQTLIRAIHDAKKSVVLFVYSLTDSSIIKALNQKADAGIEVRVVVDGKASPNVSRRLSPHVKLTKKFGNGLMHLKILLIDEQEIWLGSANMTKASLNMHGNLVIAMVNPTMGNYILEKETGLKKEGISPPLQKGTFSSGKQEVELWFLPDNQEASLRLKNLIRSAQKTIQIAMFTWTRRDLAQEVIEAHKRGVKVQVILDHHAGRGTGSKVVDMLQNENISVRLSSGGPLLHHKFMLIDGSTLVNGSANWTLSAFTQNDDCFIVMHDLTDEQKKTMEKLWEILQSESRPAD